MTIKPASVIFGYWPPVNGKRIDDPPEIAAAISKAKAGAREVPWTIAEAALVELGNKPRPGYRIYYEDGTSVYFPGQQSLEALKT